MKGFVKGVKRAPHLVTSKVGISKKSTDSEFDEYQRHFGIMEQALEKLLKNSKTFIESVMTLFTTGPQFAAHFAAIFHPISGEYDLIGKHPSSARTIRQVDKFQAAMEELKTAISPEIELIESRVLGPTRELQAIMKSIRKSITKRDHKLTDYDRFNNSLTKLRDKKEKSLSDEKNMFKLEQDFEVASNEYDYVNNALKTDLPQFMQLATQFIDPLFHSFFYMQLNIFYVLLEKMNAIAGEGKYDSSNIPGAQIVAEYEERRSEAYLEVESLGITKRLVSVARVVQQARQQNGTLARSPTNTTSSSLSRNPTSVSTPPLSRAASSSSTSGRAPSHAPPAFVKKAPPPPPSLGSKAAPPPYTATGPTALAAAKKAPPPPPPLKSKPSAATAQYVVALYEFQAQAAGDLSFNVGDRIEIVERTKSTEDWWTGKLNGKQGVFPGNYVQTT